MHSRRFVAVLLAVLTALTLLLLIGHGPWAGGDLVAITDSYLLNTGDIPVILAWALGAFCCWRLWDA